MSDFEREVFCIDSIPGAQFEGWHDGSDWNGFACPYFERQVAEQNLSASSKNGFIWSYNGEKDAFEVRSANDPIDYDPEIFEGQQITSQQDQVKVYPIGAYSWIWSICDQ